MSEVFQNNEVAYRACILYETLHGKSVEEAYENMKKVKPNVEYSDFEYWFYRFSNGRHDLNHDRSTDPSLADMPINVMEKIVGDLDLADKLSTRKVCRKLRAVIDDQVSEFGEVGLTIDEKSCEIYHEDFTIRYSAQENGNYLLETPRKTMSLKGDHSIAAIEEFASVITHPKWSFVELNIYFDKEESHPEYERKSILFLNSLLSNHKIHVEILRIHARTLEPFATLLPHFETDYLDFDCCSPMNDTNLLEVIVKMDKWKKVKEFYLRSLPDEFPIEVLFHARECYVHNVKLTEDRLMKIRDILFKTPTFEHWFFYDKKDKNREELSVLIDRVMGAHDAYNSHDKVYRIENSKDYIQISIKGTTSNQLNIRRIRS